MISYGFIGSRVSFPRSNGPAWARRSGISGARRSEKLIEYSGGNGLARRLGVVRECRK